MDVTWACTPALCGRPKGLGEQGNMGHLNWPMKTENILENITKTILRLKNAVNQFGSNLRDQIGSHKMSGPLNLGNKGTQANFKRKQRFPPPPLLLTNPPSWEGLSYHPFRLTLGTLPLHSEWKRPLTIYSLRKVSTYWPRTKKKKYIYIYIYIEQSKSSWRTWFVSNCSSLTACSQAILLCCWPGVLANLDPSRFGPRGTPILQLIYLSVYRYRVTG